MWEVLGEGGPRFAFPAVAGFPRAPKFVGGRRQFPSGEEARINEIQANTFRAFVNICPDFNTLAPIITEEDKRNKAQLNDQIKRRGSSAALSSSAPMSPSSGQQAATDELHKSKYARTVQPKNDDTLTRVVHACRAVCACAMCRVPCRVRCVGWRAGDRCLGAGGRARTRSRWRRWTRAKRGGRRTGSRRRRTGTAPSADGWARRRAPPSRDHSPSSSPPRSLTLRFFLSSLHSPDT